ncbi:hypothetical protein FQN54_008103 [Arachnomyces sp. PD_36]|nr:hypothetical protein FQN54_008103 [Arachnomyces sp. PD_36]
MPFLESAVVSALKILRDASPDELRAHRDLAAKTWKQVGIVINSDGDVDSGNNSDGHVDSSNISGSEDVLSLSPTDDVPQPDDIRTSSPRQTPLPPTSAHTLPLPGSKPAKFLVKMKEKEDLRAIVKFSEENQELGVILQKEKERPSNEHIHHLKMVSGNKTPTKRQRVLRSLSQISLSWQVLLLNPTRLGEICKLLSKVPRRNGVISQYIRSRDIAEEDHSVVRHGIQDGTVQIVFWKLLKEELSDEDKDISLRIVAYVTILRFRTFQSLSYAAMPELIKLILLDLKSAESKSILKELSKWFMSILSSYHTRFSKNFAATPQAHPPSGSRKRKSSDDHQGRETAALKELYSIWRPNSRPCLSPESSSTDSEDLHSPLDSRSSASSTESPAPRHQHTAKNVQGTRNLNESDSQAVETLSGLRSGSNILNADGGYYFPRSSDNVPQLPASSAPNMQPGNVGNDLALSNIISREHPRLDSIPDGFQLYPQRNSAGDNNPAPQINAQGLFQQGLESPPPYEYNPAPQVNAYSLFQQGLELQPSFPTDFNLAPQVNAYSLFQQGLELPADLPSEYNTAPQFNEHNNFWQSSQNPRRHAIFQCGLETSPNTPSQYNFNQVQNIAQPDVSSIA